MKTLYVVMYRDDSWGNTGDYILGIYDNEKEAYGLANRVINMKNDFKELSGSKVYVEVYTLNEQAVSDEDIDHYYN